ncbi:DNA dC-_dU-editing enzyme APOBEC-3H [Macaca mulatta]|uniref:DNA dC->dU-editing enzyme APOBEC-3H n=1 Tax=Macaca mulatta TaxID=9544 RepID=G7N3W1_MACMU|nr:DNA dC->dU-editing enzyme APOBEC-3H [Macaca mulatta]
MALLTAKTFSLQFNNKRRVNNPYYPRKALLCYQLTPQNGSTPTRGHLKNKEFTDCWENFVDHKEPPSFNPSEKLEELDKNSQAIKRRLERIKSRSVDVLENGLRSLQLGPVTPLSSIRNSR